MKKKLRNIFVTHDGQKNLEIKDMGFPPEKLFEEFEKLVNENTINKVSDLLKCDFSTTSQVEKAASTICIMSSMKKYFKYSDKAACGIKYVSLLGTRDDWIKLKDKTKSLKTIMETSFVNKITYIIEKLIDTYDNKIDKIFWNKVISTKTEKRKEGERIPYGSRPFAFARPIEYLEGWLFDFFYYDSQRAQRNSKWQLEIIPNFISYAAVKFIDFDGTLLAYKLFGTGFSGVSEIIIKKNIYSYKPMTSVCVGTTSKKNI